jgi:hypothetical protein
LRKELAEFLLKRLRAKIEDANDYVDFDDQFSTHIMEDLSYYFEELSSVVREMIEHVQ